MVNTAAWAAQFRAAAQYVEGDAPAYLQLLDSAGAATGDPVPFNPDHRGDDMEPTGAGGLAASELQCTVREVLKLGRIYSYGAHRWRVESEGHHEIGEIATVYHYTLQRQAT